MGGDCMAGDCPGGFNSLGLEICLELSEMIVCYFIGANTKTHLH